MMNSNLQQIIQIAKTVRSAVKFKWYRSDLSGACAIASRVLCLELDKRGIDCELITGFYDVHDHCWVNVEGMILDITASQFGLPDIHFTTSDIYKIADVVNYKDETDINNIFAGWFNYQIPSKENIDDILFLLP